MNINCNDTNNVNFTSALSLQGFKVDKKKLNNVAKIFAEKTKNQDDEFVLTNTRIGVNIYHYDKNMISWNDFTLCPASSGKSY